MALFRSIGAALDDDGTGTEPIDTRKGLAGLFSGPGVLPGAASPLVEGTGGFEYQVNAAHWVTSRGGSDGVHLWGNDGPITVPTDVAPGAGLSRIDIIYALHPSNGENADTSSQPVVAVAKGVAASTPIAPPIPTGALELARNTMSSGASDTAGAGNSLSQTAPRATLGSGWQPYTPTLTNVTLGNGSLIGRYRDDGETVHFTIALIAGSTTSFTGVIQVGLPAPPASAGTTVGAGMQLSPYRGVFYRATGSSLYIYNASDGSAWDSGTSFATGSSVRLAGSYERA